VTQPIYVCGHAPDELDRLRTQGAFFAEITRGAFEAAGLRPGSRVLDIGCGVGDVSFLAADTIGPGGFVVGVDRAPEAIAAARARAQAEGRTNVQFRVGAIDAIDESRAAARHVRPGGAVVILESAMSACVAGAHSFPHSPTYDRIIRLITDTIAAAGADVSMGLRLDEVFALAGLARPKLRLHARVEGGRDAAIYRYITESLRSVLPLAEAFAVAGCADVDIDQLEKQLREETVASRGVLVSPPVIAASTSVGV
jgi:SAM-dependent methyltransferase